jgi:serine/threonine protein kinase
MNTADSPMKNCPQCGQPLAEASAEGLCARCLLSAAARPGVKTMTDAPGSGEALSPENLAPLFPNLEILELIGRGGMGAVYKARQVALDRIVALKVLPSGLGADPQFAERFLREARALAKLNHPNIVTVHDFGESGGRYYLVMEFIDGANLRQMLRAGELQPKEAVAIVPKICEALQYAHDHGVVHRDIKPENVLLDRAGRVKIADFGLAKLLGKDAADFSLTQTGMHLGTPRYMAPEQFDHPETVDHRADIYSLGVVFYEMLTGEVPMGRFDPPSAKVQVDVRLDEIVLRSLEKNIERRYQHVSEVKTELDRVAGLSPEVAARMKGMIGYEYKSRRMMLGVPLVHVAFGVDPVTGRRRVAEGIFAVGDVAKGVVAFGGRAVGVFAFGGVAVGGIALGGVAAGGVAMGGLGLALLFAFAGLAIGPIAMGGLAVGFLAAGGAAFGVHAAGGNVRDPVAQILIERWMKPAQSFFWALFGVGLLAQIATTVWIRRMPKQDSAPEPIASAASPTRGARHVLGALLGLFWLATFFFAANFTASMQTGSDGRRERIQIGSLDPLFTYEQRPDGFSHSVNFASWSFFSLAVSVALFIALLRVGREDSGKVPRETEWWVSWWKNVGIWCGLLLIVCTLRTAINSAQSAAQAKPPALEQMP